MYELKNFIQILDEQSEIIEGLSITAKQGRTKVMIELFEDLQDKLNGYLKDGKLPTFDLKTIKEYTGMSPSERGLWTILTGIFNVYSSKACAYALAQDNYDDANNLAYVSIQINGWSEQYVRHELEK